MRPPLIRVSLLPLLILLGTHSWSAATPPPEKVPFLTYEEPVYPAALAMTPVINGHATVAFTTDSDGKVDDALILSSNHPAFAESVLVAARNWRVIASPADTVTGHTTRREIMYYEFRRHGSIISLTHLDSMKAIFSKSLDDAQEIQTVAWKKLTTPPAQIFSKNPKYPAALSGQHLAGSATVDFVIDQTGAVRVPAVVAADRAEFATAALEAVKQWRFEPPLQNGQPVNVEVQRRFRFGQSK